MLIKTVHEQKLPAALVCQQNSSPLPNGFGGGNWGWNRKSPRWIVPHIFVYLNPPFRRSIWSGSFALPDVKQKPSNRPITVLHTPRKINMEPKNPPNWKGKSSSKPSFSGSMLNLPGCISEGNNKIFTTVGFFVRCELPIHVACCESSPHAPPKISKVPILCYDPAWSADTLELLTWRWKTIERFCEKGEFV